MFALVSAFETVPAVLLMSGNSARVEAVGRDAPWLAQRAEIALIFEFRRARPGSVTSGEPLLDFRFPGLTVYVLEQSRLLRICIWRMCTLRWAMETTDVVADRRSDDGRYRRLIEAVTDYAIYMLDSTGIVSSWNPGAQRFKGYTPSEIIGQHFSRFYTEDDSEAGDSGARARDGRADGEVRKRRLAGPQGRLPLLGPCRHRSDPQRGRRHHRLCQDHARLKRTQGGRGFAANEARSSSGCWSRVLPTTPSTCSIWTAQ